MDSDERLNAAILFTGIGSLLGGSVAPSGTLGTFRGADGRDYSYQVGGAPAAQASSGSDLSTLVVLGLVAYALFA